MPCFKIHNLKYNNTTRTHTLTSHILACSHTHAHVPLIYVDRCPGIQCNAEIVNNVHWPRTPAQHNVSMPCPGRNDEHPVNATGTCVASGFAKYSFLTNQRRSYLRTIVRVSAIVPIDTLNVGSVCRTHS